MTLVIFALVRILANVGVNPILLCRAPRALDVPTTVAWRHFLGEMTCPELMIIIMNPNKIIHILTPEYSPQRRTGWWRRFIAGGLVLGLASLSQAVRAQSYATSVLAGSPVAFWQLSETNSPAAATVPAYDSTGNGYNGTYGTDAQDFFSGILAPQPPAYQGFATNQGALLTTASDVNSSVSLPPLNLNTNTVTITMWINPNGTGVHVEPERRLDVGL